jgi:ribosomal RNA-processing protein 17
LEYEGEEQLATVTIVEEFEADDLKNAHPTSIKDEQKLIPAHNLSKRSKANEMRRPKPVVKPKAKFRYETKAARKHEKQKQRARREEKASRGHKKGRRR